MPTVSVKWRQEVFSNIEIDTRLSPFFLKSQLYILTHVPQGKQKIMFKGRLIKDDTDWSTLGINDGQTLMMMGTADKMVRPAATEDHSAGLYNLGSTSYVNATLQCLHCVPELKSALLSYTNASRPNGVDLNSHLLTIATRDLFKKLDLSANPVDPSLFILALHMKFPLFALQHNRYGVLHFAELLWTDIMDTLYKSLGSSSGSSSSDATAVVKTLFGIELFCSIYQPELRGLRLWKDLVCCLKCFVNFPEVNFHQALKLSLDYKWTEFTSVSNLPIVWSAESWICELPKYLTIRFEIFTGIWEPYQIRKFLHRMDYPLELDMYEYCTPGLKQQLLGTSSDEGKAKVMDIDMPSNKSQVTGMYDLVAVLTHKGTYDHHVAFVKQETGWIEYDDHVTTLRSEEYITELSGGGNGHTPYIGLYKTRQI